jgi:hypothetical protein
MKPNLRLVVSQPVYSELRTVGPLAEYWKLAQQIAAYLIVGTGVAAVMWFSAVFFLSFGGPQ